MNTSLDKGNRPEEIIRVVEDKETDDFVGVGAIKFKENLAELGSTIIRKKDRKKVNREEEKVYEELFKDRLNDTAEIVEDPSEPVDIIYTQLLADKSASTQHVAHKNDFAVTGVYDKKFPMAYEDKGRVTVVDMIWADSEIENSQEEVFTTKGTEELVESALENINEKRSNEYEDIERELSSDHIACEAQNYEIDITSVGDPMNFAEISVIQKDSGEYSWSNVLEEIDKISDKLDNQKTEEQDYWIGVSLDANNPYCPSAAENLEDLGFEYAGFNPGKLEMGRENIDSLEMQLRGNSEYNKQFIGEAANFIEALDLEYSNAEEDTGHYNSEVISI